MARLEKRGFTLIELISVLVIMTVILLIATPLVMNIIRKARLSADRKSIDTYGHSIEQAIASYLLNNGKYPKEISQLTVQYSGKKVECETERINFDSSIYLNECSVGGRSINYEYGHDIYPSYVVGDKIRYNSANYYVIKDSGSKESTVKLLKAEPLTVDEINLYGGVGTDHNHVNMYVTNNTDSEKYRKALDLNGYGGVAYYSSETCGYNPIYITSGCTSDYNDSEVKYIVDAWRDANLPAGTEARLIKVSELKNLGMTAYSSSIYDWLTVVIEYYWTMSSWDTMSMWCAQYVIHTYNFVNDLRLLRPVITISKTVLY